MPCCSGILVKSICSTDGLCFVLQVFYTISYRVEAFMFRFPCRLDILPVCICLSTVWALVLSPVRAHMPNQQNLHVYFSAESRVSCPGLYGLLIRLHSLTSEQSCRSSKAEANFIFTRNCVSFYSFYSTSLSFNVRLPSSTGLSSVVEKCGKLRG